MFDTFTQKFPRDYTAAYTNMCAYPTKHFRTREQSYEITISQEHLGNVHGFNV